MKKELPHFLKPFLWSYDLSKMDVFSNKRRIITNILNYGNKKSTDWLFKTYSKEDIFLVLKDPLAGEWNKKSLNFWSLIFGLNK